jgi:hypothetical protein
MNEWINGHKARAKYDIEQDKLQGTAEEAELRGYLKRSG